MVIVFILCISWKEYFFCVLKFGIIGLLNYFIIFLKTVEVGSVFVVERI